MLRLTEARSGARVCDPQQLRRSASGGIALRVLTADELSELSAGTGNDLVEDVNSTNRAGQIVCVAVLFILVTDTKLKGQSVYSVHAGSHLSMRSTNSADWIYIPAIHDWSFSAVGYRFGLEQYNWEWTAIHVGHWKRILHRTAPECVAIAAALILTIVLGWFVVQRQARMGTKSASTRTESS